MALTERAMQYFSPDFSRNTAAFERPFNIVVLQPPTGE